MDPEELKRWLEEYYERRSTEGKRADPRGFDPNAAKINEVMNLVNAQYPKLALAGSSTQSVLFQIVKGIVDANPQANTRDLIGALEPRLPDVVENAKKLDALGGPKDTPVDSAGIVARAMKELGWTAEQVSAVLTAPEGALKLQEYMDEKAGVKSNRNTAQDAASYASAAANYAQAEKIRDEIARNAVIQAGINSGTLIPTSVDGVFYTPDGKIFNKAEIDVAKARLAVESGRLTEDVRNNKAREALDRLRITNDAAYQQGQLGIGQEGNRLRGQEIQNTYAYNQARLGFDVSAKQADLEQGAQRLGLDTEVARLNAQDKAQQNNLARQMYISKVLASPSDFIARAFMQRGEASPTARITQADLINQVNNEYTKAPTSFTASSLAPGGPNALSMQPSLPKYAYGTGDSEPNYFEVFKTLVQGGTSEAKAAEFINTMLAQSNALAANQRLAAPEPTPQIAEPVPQGGPAPRLAANYGDEAPAASGWSPSTPPPSRLDATDIGDTAPAVSGWAPQTGASSQWNKRKEQFDKDYEALKSGQIDGKEFEKRNKDLSDDQFLQFTRLYGIPTAGAAALAGGAALPGFARWLMKGNQYSPAPTFSMPPIDLKYEPGYAYGTASGYVNDKTAIVGDPQADGGPNPEIIHNPTGAPISVTPMKDMGRMQMATQGQQPAKTQDPEEKRVEALSRLLQNVKNPDTMHALVDEIADARGRLKAYSGGTESGGTSVSIGWTPGVGFTVGSGQALTGTAAEAAANSGFSTPTAPSAPAGGGYDIGTANVNPNYAQQNRDAALAASRAIPTSTTPSYAYNIPRLVRPEIPMTRIAPELPPIPAVLQEEILAKAENTLPPALRQLFGGDATQKPFNTVGGRLNPENPAGINPLKFGFNLFSPQMLAQLTNAEKEALNSYLGVKYNTSLEDVLVGMQQSFGRPATRTGRLAIG